MFMQYVWENRLMSTIGVPDAKGLEGRREGESAAPKSRDFFWDSVTLFVVTAILALTAIDVVTEFVRGSEVQCFLPNGTKSSLLEGVKDYVNEKCAASLPAAEYLPAYITIHAILILAPHYIWLNLFGANLDFFFLHVSQLARKREPKTGDYPENNYVISKQLEDAFTSGYRSNWMYKLYLFKLAIQVFVSSVGFALVLWLFTDFDDTFRCPKKEGDTQKEDWPLPNEHVVCVFTSLRLLHKIWIIYLVLLAVAILCLIVAMFWLLKDHLTELGTEDHARFSFHSGLPLHHYVPPLRLFRCFSGLGDNLYSVLSHFPSFSFASDRPYRIRSDYDFLMIKLFRTDGGLAYILREVHALRLLKDENDLELARVSIHKTQAEAGKVFAASADFLTTGLGWIVGDIKERKTLEPNTLLYPPPHIRGVVMGFAARCGGSNIIKADLQNPPPNPQNPPPDPQNPPPDPQNPPPEDKILCGALYIGFDSDSNGFAGALARIFARVGVINFSRYYSDYEHPLRLDVDNSSQVISITTPHDILMNDQKLETRLDLGDGKSKVVKEWTVEKFYQDLDEIWRPGYIYYKQTDDINYELQGHPANFTYTHRSLDTFPTDYIVIGPVTSNLQIATINMLLEKKDDFLSDDAALLTITPLVISGKTVKKDQFRSFTPLLEFTPLRQKAKEPPQELPHDGFPWPPISPAALGSNITAQEPFDWTVKTGATNSMFRFILYKRGQHSATGTGGQTTAGPTVTATTTTATTAGQMTTTTIQTATTTGQISVPIAPTTTTSGTS